MQISSYKMNTARDTVLLTVHGVLFHLNLAHSIYLLTHTLNCWNNIC